MDRRKVLSTSAVGVAALAGCATGPSGPGTAGGWRTVLSVRSIAGMPTLDVRVV